MERMFTKRSLVVQVFARPLRSVVRNVVFNSRLLTSCREFARSVTALACNPA